MGSTRSAGTVVVVGAAQGIGQAVARRLAREPGTTRLVLADIRGDAVTILAAELATTTGIEVEPVTVDVTSVASIDGLVARAPDASRLAVVAGIFRASPSLEVGWDEFTQVTSVNLLGNFFVAQAFARCMVERGGGAIVAVASIASRLPRMRQAAYAASKAGMRQALRVLALETVPLGVRINFVSPGPTDTPMMRDLAADHDFAELSTGDLTVFRPRIPSGRVATPEDVADGVAFLLSDAAGHIALHDLYVDGGESLGL
ncbi:MAG: SDR family oxidoreductase [Chloroflexi bacterium]|nr:SDR family oxidoreductase [Chloroflexota bacterium]